MNTPPAPSIEVIPIYQEPKSGTFAMRYSPDSAVRARPRKNALLFAKIARNSETNVIIIAIITRNIITATIPPVLAV